MLGLPRLRAYQESICVLETRLNLLFWAIGYNQRDLIGVLALSPLFLFSIPSVPLLTNEKTSEDGGCTILMPVQDVGVWHIPELSTDFSLASMAINVSMS